MCLILFALNCHSRYPLVVAANRDEFHDRSTAALDFWSAEPGLLAGRDLVAGGTWLGVSRKGRFAAVTNVRTAAAGANYPRSRGDLCIRWLSSDTQPLDFAASLDVAAYAPFNLLFGTLDGIYYLSSTTADPLLLKKACYGLSNSSLDMSWPKVHRGKQALRATIDAGAELDQLLELLTDRSIADDNVLPDTGVGLDQERLMSAAFIVGPSYGTRSSTALRISSSGDLDICERRFDRHGKTTGETRKRLPDFFDLDAGA